MSKSKFEIRAQKYLENLGYLVDWKIRPSGFKNPTGYQVDFLGLFDLMAYKPGEPLRFISVKGQSGVPKKHRDEIENFWLPESCQKEIWQYRKLKGKGNRFIPKMQIYLDGEWKVHSVAKSVNN